MDFPGDEADLYISLKYIDCEVTPQEEYWSGHPNNDEPPQYCDNCEQESYGKGPLAGHGLKLLKDNAWNFVRGGLSAAGTDTSHMSPEYHRIPQATAMTVGINHPICFVAAPIVPREGQITDTRFIGFETLPIPNPDLTPTNNLSIQRGTGAQVLINYRVGSEQRKGYVWLID